MNENAAVTLRARFALAATSPIVVVLMFLLTAGSAWAASVSIVALGASNTYGKNVARNQSYPAQLEAMLRARGLDVRVDNAGINGDTTGGMLSRLDRAVPAGTALVLLQPGSNDARKGQGDGTANIAAINSHLAARGIKVMMVPNQMSHGLPHQPDGIHLTPEGYRMLAAALVSQVSSAIGQ
jgi:acyl-CoA thioesterase I